MMINDKHLSDFMLFEWNITAQKYLTAKGKLAFYWLIVFITMTTAISSHVKDKNNTFTACGEDMIF